MNEKYSKEDLLYIAEELVEELRECKNGTVMTTATLARDYGYERMDDSDLFELDRALRREARANRITLDIAEHNGKEEGLPFNLPFVVKNKKAQIKCPFCGSKDTARYLYGMPVFDEKMIKKLDDGILVLGGCCVYSYEINGKSVSSMPSRRCNKCKRDFGTAPLLIAPKTQTAEDYRCVVKSIYFSLDCFFQGRVNVTITRNDKGANVKVNKFPADPEIQPDKQITIDKWNRILDKLYIQMYLHEWKKKYVNPNVMDGTQWELKIKMTGRRERNYYGSNDYPPYWTELKNIFREYIPKTTE